ncbi:hypothetical protein BDQ12DRAFT_669656 [Crucibulum laeve]|uniref:Uncharacterized protein n=1 Tax=Crucibulum laeve TaxID=68775 RepID=A0A5C3LLT7_9AGAR|nr:hypothetical protein BDQ12DRAFT_669656 [Crucibulum laeve]
MPSRPILSTLEVDPNDPYLLNISLTQFYCFKNGETVRFRLSSGRWALAMVYLWKEMPRGEHPWVRHMICPRSRRHAERSYGCEQIYSVDKWIDHGRKNWFYNEYPICAR